jgi:hypothetical protein
MTTPLQGYLRFFETRREIHVSSMDLFAELHGFDVSCSTNESFHAVKHLPTDHLLTVFCSWERGVGSVQISIDGPVYDEDGEVKEWVTILPIATFRK